MQQFQGGGEKVEQKVGQKVATALPLDCVPESPLHGLLLKKGKAFDSPLANVTPSPIGQLRKGSRRHSTPVGEWGGGSARGGVGELRSPGAGVVQLHSLGPASAY